MHGWDETEGHQSARQEQQRNPNQRDSLAVHFTSASSKHQFAVFSQKRRFSKGRARTESCLRGGICSGHLAPERSRIQGSGWFPLGFDSELCFLRTPPGLEASGAWAKERVRNGRDEYDCDAEPYQGDAKDDLGTQGNQVWVSSRPVVESDDSLGCPRSVGKRTPSTFVGIHAQRSSGGGLRRAASIQADA